MKKRETTRRNTMDWAGSSPASGPASGPPPLTAGIRDVYRVREMRHKLNDDGYVDDAVTRIASFLTNTLEKKEKDGK